jgi:hypothetical protein
LTTKPRIHDELIERAYKACTFERGRTFHVSYIVRRNKILATGFNDEYKSATISRKYGAPTESLHSEMDAFIKYSRLYGIDALEACTHLNLYNVRIDRLGRIRIARPCGACQRLIRYMDFNRVFYTTNEGVFKGF